MRLVLIVLLCMAAGQSARLHAQRVGTSPADGDTVGYWQQRANYDIIARLDEPRQLIVATGTLKYTNNSPDELTEMFVHQYLNAFRPYSKWSDADEREGRLRFQNLEEPANGFERFTARPTVDGVPVVVEYPGAPDSTVARFALPRPLRPGQTITVSFAWEARPSTTFRRQGRKGRHYDLAQWYPKVAVYDRGGWQQNALVPAGELYGEFGDFRVALVLAEDQVVSATGVPVSGDPGWDRVKRNGTVSLLQRTAYGAPASSAVPIASAGLRTVVFEARNVHHFAWSTDPEYRYEGGMYLRPKPGARPQYRIWDTVAVHSFYRPGDDTTWGRGVVVQRTIDALKWLEEVYGPYAYPQISAVHRLDAGGTEFPMLMHNGSASFDLILHEGGHIFTYGILANNEWRSGWMDEGLTSYQTSWREGRTPQERAATALSRDPRWLATPLSGTALERRLKYIANAEPLSTNAEVFRSFNSYNAMVYTRAEEMYGALRDVMGDAYFSAFLKDYYGRWALKHVDRVAMQRAVERNMSRPMNWFFDQWLDSAGEVQYALKEINTAQRRANEWVTTARLVRVGAYRHPMPVGVRTATGWTFVRGDPMRDDQRITITTPDKPDLVRLDPLGLTDDVRAGSQQWPAPTP